MVKKPTKREQKLVAMWRVGMLTIPELAKKLQVTKVGAYSTIARVYKHSESQDE